MIRQFLRLCMTVTNKDYTLLVWSLLGSSKFSGKKINVTFEVQCGTTTL